MSHLVYDVPLLFYFVGVKVFLMQRFLRIDVVSTRQDGIQNNAVGTALHRTLPLRVPLRTPLFRIRTRTLPKTEP